MRRMAKSMPSTLYSWCHTCDSANHDNQLEWHMLTSSSIFALQNNQRLQRCQQVHWWYAEESKAVMDRLISIA